MRPSSFFGGSCSISSIFHFSTFCCALCVATHILIRPALRMSIRAVPVPVPQSLLWTAQAVLSRTGGSSGSPPPPTPPLRLTRSFRLVGSRHASSCGGRKKSSCTDFGLHTCLFAARARGEARERASCLLRRSKKDTDKLRRHRIPRTLLPCRPLCGNFAQKAALVEASVREE